MDKIERSLHITDWNVYDKLDELVEGYNEIMKLLRDTNNEIDEMKKLLRSYCVIETKKQIGGLINNMMMEGDPDQNEK